MKHTEFAVLDDEELVGYTLTRPNVNSLERELAQRLSIYMDLITKQEEELISINEQFELEDVYEQNARGKSKRLC